MKKQLFSLVALLFCALTTTFAQSPLVATLSHNDTVSVYYGRSAFQDAYNASTHGDVITLSSGSFDVPSIINKNITIRGAGMKKDSVNNVFPTILMRDFTIYSLSDTIAGRLMMEGVYCNGKITCGYYRNSTEIYNLRKSQFVKCLFDKIESYKYSYLPPSSLNSVYSVTRGVKLYNVTFFQCIVKSDITVGEGNAIFHNCILFNPKLICTSSNNYFDYRDYAPKMEFFNCVLINPSSYIEKSEFDNSILWGNVQLVNTNVAYQCVANYTGIATGGAFANLIGDLGNVSLSDRTALFKTFRGTYSETETFELTDSAKVKYLGTDGTQVGIYGGTLPFSPQVSMPQIKKFKVAPKSTNDGKLSVEIEVSAAE